MQYNEFLETARDSRMDGAVSAAAELFLREGIENVKMTDIAAGAGVGVASLYRYFGTKTEIVIRVGILEWQKVKGLFNGVFDCDYYNAKSGIEQIHDLLKIQLVLFRSHKDFLRFLNEFDIYMTREKVEKNQLAGYENGIMNIYPAFENAYKKGIEDGSVNPDADFALVYRSVSHSLMSLCEKFIMGEILPSDRFESAEDEINLIIAMALGFLKSGTGKGKQ